MRGRAVIPAHPSGDLIETWIADVLNTGPVRAWSATELSEQTNINVHVLRTLLPNMVSHGLIVEVGVGRYVRPTWGDIE